MQCFTIPIATLVFYYKPVHETNCSQMQGANLFACDSSWVSSLQQLRKLTLVVLRGGTDVKVEQSSDESGHELSQLLPATGVSSAHRNAFPSVQRGLGRTWQRGPPGRASQHMAKKDEEFKGSYGLWEFWAAQNPQCAEGKRNHKPTMNHNNIPNGSLLSLPGQLYTSLGIPVLTGLEFTKSSIHPSLQDLGIRDEPQACFCCPEERRKKCW